MIDEVTALESVGGDPETLRDVKDLLVQETPGLVDGMAEALASGDWDAFEAAAHTCKGMYLVFGPNPVAAIARDLESLAERGDAAGAERALARLSTAIDEVYSALAIRSA